MIPYRKFHRLIAPSQAAVLGVVAAAVVCAVPCDAASPRVVITPAAGFTITWDGNNGGFSSPDAGAGPSANAALASNGTVAFSSSDLGPELGIPFHVAANLNDGLYGNINSWISGGAPDPYAALRFASTVDISSIAWGRDNGLATGDSCGGTCTDRAVGIYTLQYTAVTAPDATTPDTGDAATGWITIGTIEYLPGADDVNFASYLRHRFDVAEFGAPLAATGLRIKVSVGGIGGGLDIDEIEVNPLPDPIPPISNFIEISPEPGFAISWDRNDGLFSTVDNPAPVPANDASVARGVTAFTSTDLGPAIGVPFHVALNLNDGLYGNANSWIPNFVGGDANPFAGVSFGRSIELRNIAWGRDNGNVAGDCCGGTLTDRALGVYIVQVTTVANPGATTADADWMTVGTINYKANGPIFNSHLRHRFDVLQGGSPITATGVRIKVPNSNTAIDEIEVNGNTAIEQEAIQIAGVSGFSIRWDGNDGQFSNPDIGAAPPANRALASAGTVPFTSTDLGPLLGIPFHVAANLNDGLYGNANSWISANGVGGASDLDPFAGLNFGGEVSITNIAWGRDNGNVAGDCCGGTLTDRALGAYRLQYTAVVAPDATTPETGDAATGWADVGTVTYNSASLPFFTPHLRHRFEIAESGGPLVATGIRIKVSNGSMDIDEIEVNAPLVVSPNNCPTAGTLTIALDQDSSANFNLAGADTDGDALQYAVTAPPQHGSVIVNVETGAASYTPAVGYVGPDSFRYTASDGRCTSGEGTVSLEVRPVNHPPTAQIDTDALVDFSPDFENPVLISCNWWNACLILDGSLSSDPDGDALSHLWFVEPSPVPFAAGAVATNCLEVGVHTIVLTVTDSDGASDSDSLTIEVLTAPLAIELLMEKVNESRVTRAIKRELLAVLRTALNQSKNERIRPTQTTLDAFEKKVRAKVVGTWPDDAAAWIRWSQAISSGMEKCIKAPVVKKEYRDNKKGEDDGEEQPPN